MFPIPLPENDVFMVVFLYKHCAHELWCLVFFGIGA